MQRTNFLLLMRISPCWSDFYSNMKPAQAAAVLGKMDAVKSAAILQRLDTRSAGPILAGMDPQAALAVTEELAQRHAGFRR